MSLHQLAMLIIRQLVQTDLGNIGECFMRGADAILAEQVADTDTEML